MTRLFLLLAAALLAVPAPAQTPAIDRAKAAGVVGERFDGYLGLVSAAAPAIAKEVASINIQRRALYSRLAAAKGASVQEVGITAGCAVLRRVAIGQSYMLSDGAWRRRGGGDPPPAPSYCG